jgi:hypothetical protein
MKSSAKVWALSATLSLLLSGCQAGDSESYGGYDYGVIEQEMSAGRSPEFAEGQKLDPSTTEPDVMTTGYLSLIVPTPSSAADEITTIVENSGGRIQSRSDYSPVDFGQPTSYLEARIPSATLDKTLSAISAIGTVQETSVYTVDVSLQKIDLDARIQVLSAAIERLGQLLGEASTTSDLVAIETALAERQAELDSLTSQRSYLSDQTLFATISITLATPADATPKDPDGFFDGIEQGIAGILAFFAGAIVWAGILLPWLGLVLIAIVLIAVIRTLVRRRRKAEQTS